MVRFVFFFGAILFLNGCMGIQSADRSTLIHGDAFGTTYSIQIVTPTLQYFEKRSLQRQIDAMLTRIDGHLSSYNPQSELSKINAWTSLKPLSVSTETWTLVHQSLQLSQLTQGAFDPTVVELFHLWGFGKPNPVATIPTQREVQTGLKRCRSHLISAEKKFFEYITARFLPVCFVGSGKGS